MRAAFARWRPFAVVSALAGFLSGGCAQAEPIKLRAGIADPVNTVLAWWTAQAAGLYAREGLKVDIINMGGGSRGAEALRAGTLDVMHVGLSALVKLNRAGADLRLIGSLSNVIRFTFFSAAGVKSAADLKGSVVAVSTFGSESDSTVTLALERLGLARSEVTLKEYGGARQRLAALQSGEIKATALNEPFTSLAREAGVNVMVDLVPEQIPWLFSGIAVTRSALQSRGDALTRFLKATIEGNYLALSQETRAKAILASELNITDPKVIDISYRDFKDQSPRDIEPSRQGAENILAQFPGGNTTVADYVDTSILRGLKAQGFFAQMERQYGRP